MRTSRSRAVGYVVSAVLAATLLSGCGGTRSDEASAPAAPAISEARFGSAPADAPATTAQSPEAAAKAPADPAQVSALPRQIAYEADMTVEVRRLDEAIIRVKQLVAAAGGRVVSETMQADGAVYRPLPPEGSSTTAMLSIDVPPDKYQSLLESLGKLGHRVSFRSGSEDVTEQVVDVEARLKTQRDSIARLRALLGRANTVDDVVKVESELSRRVADLEALEARRKALADRVTMSKVTLTLTTDAPTRYSGFLGGLQDGWEAFLAFLSWLVTTLGRILPFLVFFLLVPGLPLVWLIRRRRTHRANAGRTVAGPSPAAAPLAEEPRKQEAGGPSGG